MSFQLQLLHASDLEGGVDAIQNAPNFAAIANFFDTTFTPDDGNTGGSLIISAGDNYLPGPFFSAQSDDRAVEGVLQSVYERFYGLEAGSLNEIETESGFVDIAIMNLIGFDASAVGNHEFDLGTATFADIIQTEVDNDAVIDELEVGEAVAIQLGEIEHFGAQFPYLSSNLDFSADSNLGGLFTSEIQNVTDYQALPSGDLTALFADDEAVSRLAPSAFAVVDGTPVGIIGLTTPVVESISSTGDVTTIGASDNDVQALADIVNAEVARHRALGVETIILTTHLQQFTLEEQLAPLLNGVDVIISGGSDTILLDENDVARAGDTADRNEYPVLTMNAEGNPVAIVSTNGEYTYVGRLVVEFDENGNLIADSVDSVVSGSYETTNDGVARVVTDGSATVDGDTVTFADDTIADLVQELTDSTVGVVSAQDGNIQGQTAVFLEGRRTAVRTEETNIGNITADANLAYAQNVDPTVQISIKNGGGIRNPIGVTDPETGALLPTQANELSGKEEGEISQLDIADSLRFNNGLTLQTLTAAQVAQTIEHAVAGTSAEFGANTPGQFAQVGGLTYSYDPTQPGVDAGDDGFDPTVLNLSRLQYLAVTDADGNVVDVLVNNGEIVGDPSRAFRIVTLDFIAGGGDRYPFEAFAELDPAFANVVDLEGAPEGDAADPGLSDFAPSGTEQDAFAEFLAGNFPVAGAAFNTAETPASEDLRIQNLTQRDFVSIDPDSVVIAYTDVNDELAPLYATGSEAVIGIFAAAGSFNALPDDADQGVDVFRFVNPDNGDTVLTTSTVEADAIRAAGLLTDDGSLFNAFASDQGDATIPVFRVFSTGLGHVYTADETERDAFLADGFLDEGVAFFVFGSDVDLIG